MKLPMTRTVLLHTLFLLSLIKAAPVPAADVSSPVDSRIQQTLQVARRLSGQERQLLNCAESLPAIQAALGDGSLISCECSDSGAGSSTVTCQDFCQLCRDELGLCVTYDFEFGFVAGRLDSFVGRLEYSGSRTDRLEFGETYLGNGVDIESCSSIVNGVQCTSCTTSTGGCTDGVVYDCSNIESGAVFDECQGDFEQIEPSSVFVGYNIEYFDDALCIYFPTASPAPTLTPMPTVFDPYPDLIPYPFDQLRIGLQFKAINADAFVQVIVDYLTHNLNYFYPKLVGVVLNRVAPPLHAKLYERSTFVLEGDAFFMGGGPNPKALDAAVRYLMSDVDRIQQVLHKNAPSIGRDVYVTFTGIVPLPDDKTDEDDPVPPKQQPQRPWYIRSKAGKSVKSTKSSKQQQQPHGVRPTSFQQRHKRKFLQGQTWAIGGPRRKKRGYWVKQPKSSKSSGSSQKKRAGVDQYY